MAECLDSSGLFFLQAVLLIHYKMGVTVTGIADSGTGTRKGTYKFKSGSFYEGQWAEGKPDGIGKGQV